MAVIGLTISTIHAGSDTTASTLGILMNDLLRNPSKLASVEAELAAAELSDPPRFAELNKLPYLDACIKESMRNQTIVGGPAERVVPSSGAEIAGTWVPGGTVVSVSQHVVNHDSAIWGPSPTSYNPDRWIEADEMQRRRMERASTSFSAGKRICLGQHIAWLEMKKLIPRLLMTFKVRDQYESKHAQFLDRGTTHPCTPYLSNPRSWDRARSSLLVSCSLHMQAKMRRVCCSGDIKN